jgi:hypothetical protein
MVYVLERTKPANTEPPFAPKGVLISEMLEVGNLTITTYGI